MSEDIRKRAQAVDDWFRQRPWGKPLSPEFYMVALCGEVGEAANILKKAMRGDYELAFDYEGQRRLSLQGQALGLELADVQLYLWHLARELGIDLDQAVVEKLAINEKRWGIK